MENLTTHLWAVTADAGFAHGADCVYSVWTTESGAEEERHRLATIEPHGGGCNNGDFHVVEIVADKANDEWIG
jgi:hypothetical protein